MVVQIASDFGMETTMQCIIYEGQFTASTNAIGATGDETYRNAGTLAAEVQKGSIVQLHVNTGNTHAATKGIPVVQNAAASGLLFGILLTEPKWKTYPAGSSSATWATNLTNGHYRIGTVQLFSPVTFVGVMSSGTVTIGTQIQYDATSTSLWIVNGTDNSTTDAGVYALHYASAGELILAMFINSGFTASQVV